MNKKEKAAQENRTPKQLGITLQKSEEDLLGCQVLSSSQESQRQFHKPGPSGKDSLRLFPTPTFALAESHRRLKPLEESSCAH